VFDPAWLVEYCPDWGRIRATTPEASAIAAIAATVRQPLTLCWRMMMIYPPPDREKPHDDR
jgi:hypothetical protein